MMSALQARKAFLEKQLIEKRELLNELCLREAVSNFNLWYNSQNASVICGIIYYTALPIGVDRDCTN